jgi:hypothetical protein
MDEAVEHEEEIIIENMEEPVLQAESQVSRNEDVIKEEFDSTEKEERPSVVPSISDINDSPVLTRLKFNDYDSVFDENNHIDTINAPKSIERLEEISTERAIQRKLEGEEDLDDRIKIHTDSIPLDGLEDLDRMDDFVSLDDIEELL